MSDSKHEKESGTNRGHPEFDAGYTYTDDESGEIYISPFSVAVFGVEKEFFGVGIVVGGIDDIPVIEIQDRDDGKTYYVRGSESWWTCPVPDEIIDRLARGELKVDSVAAYRTRQDDHWTSSVMDDRNFLDENGILPD